MRSTPIGSSRADTPSQEYNEKNVRSPCKIALLTIVLLGMLIVGIVNLMPGSQFMPSVASIPLIALPVSIFAVGVTIASVIGCIIGNCCKK